MTEHILQKYYDKRGLTYGMNSLRRRKVLELIYEDGIEGKKILDIGCATGYLGRDLKKENNTIVGMDISATLIGEAKRFYDEVHVLDIENDPIPESVQKHSFDFVVAAEFIEHLFDQEKFLEKVKEMLAPGGKFILTTPNFLVWNNRIKMLLGRFGIKEVFNDKSHIHLLSYTGLHEKLKGAGFTIVKENNIWYPNWLEKIHRILPAGIFVYQTIIKLQV